MKLLRIAAVNLLVLAILLAAMEIAARVYVALTRGSQTAGVRERTVYLSYQPFVMYGPKWDDVLAPARWKKAADVCRVLLVGGSTAEGFPLELLERALSRHSGGRSFQVINAGQGGYEARQEVVVASLWGPGLHPDLVISLDGANDLEHRLKVSKPGEFYLSPTYALYLKRPLLAPLAYLLSNSQLYNGIVRTLARGAVGPAEQYADAIAPYVEAQRSLNVITKGIGAARLMVLQPFSGFKHPLSAEEAAFTFYKYREATLKDLYERAASRLSALAAGDQVPYLDARHLYDGESAYIFIDDVHLTRLGYERLADAIAKMYASDHRHSACAG